LSLKTTLLQTLLPLLLLSLCGSVQAQQPVQQKGIEYRFINDSVEIRANNFHFNSLRLLNNTGTTLHCSVTTELPSFINLVTELDESIELPASEETFIPFRFNALSTRNLDSGYRFTAIIKITETGETIRAQFKVRLRPYYRWRNSLLQTEQTLTEDMKAFSTQFLLENTGNTNDVYTFSLDLPDGVNEAKKIPSVTLKPGEQKQVEIPLSINPFTLRSNAEVHIYVRNSRGEKRMLIQKLLKITHVVNQNVHRWQRFPLTGELNLRNLATDRSLINGALRGSMSLGKQRNLEMFLMSKNYYKGIQASNDQGYIKYFSPKEEYTAGYLTNFEYFASYGIGVSATRYFGDKGSKVTAGAIKSRLFNSDTYNAGYETNIGRSFSVKTIGVYNQEHRTGSTGLLNITNISWQPNSKLAVELKGGAGIGHVKALKNTPDTAISDVMTGYGVEYKVKQWNFISRLDLYGKNFPGVNKGFNKHNHEIRRTFKKDMVNVFFNADKRVYNQSYDSSIKSFFLTNNKDYGIRAHINRNKLYLAPSVSMFIQQQDSANSFTARMLKAGGTAGWNGIKDLSLTMTAQLGYVTMDKPMGINKYKTLVSSLTATYKMFGLTVQYDHNPFYYYEMKQSVEFNRLLRRLQIVPSMEFNFPKYNLNYRAQYFYIKDDLNAYNTDYLSNQVTYNVKKLGMALTVNATISTIQKNNNFTSLVLQKDLAVPFYRKHKSFDFKALLYKDKNGNNQFDAGTDELIQNADVLVDGQWLRSDANGSIVFRNMGEGNTELDFSRVSGVRGWIPRDGQRQVIDNSKVGRKLMIAFKESRSIKGKLVLVADERSEKRMVLSNIRITATNEKGLIYHTLTDNSEEFFFDLPAGVYKVSINQEAFDVDFIPTESYKMIDLNVSASEEISFEIRQRKRKVNIKVDDDDDDDDDDDEEEAADEE
jgi:hypothetical protein